MSADQSAALQEEIESINAIYGENTVTATSSSDVFVLTLPFHPTSLRISFPPTYPEVAPSILGPESSLQSSSAESGAAPTKKGDAADFADLARQVLHTCFHVGEPCIFDLLEDLRTRIEERREFTSAEQDPDSISSDGEEIYDSSSEAGYTSDSSASQAQNKQSSSLSTAANTPSRVTGLGNAAGGAASVVYNALIRTHHVTSRKKVGKVKKMAHHELRYLLIRSGGSPGLMYAEGDETSLKQWIAGVSALRYKDYQLARSPALLGEARKLQMAPGNGRADVEKSMKMAAVSEDTAGYEEVESVAQFAEAIEKRGVLRWWRQAMGYEESGNKI